MARKAFYSFHYKEDGWRASKVRNMDALEGNAPVSDNDWETVTDGGEAAIKKWISDQMSGRSCAIVLVGEGTAGRKWITHEIVTAWEKGMGVVGIRIHNLSNANDEQSASGGNPFDFVTYNGEKLSKIVKLYNPPYSVSQNVYNNIKENISDWVEEAIKIRNAN